MHHVPTSNVSSSCESPYGIHPHWSTMGNHSCWCTGGNNWYLLVMQDYFTNGMRPLKCQTWQIYASLESLWKSAGSRMRLPDILHLDWGRNFEDTIFTQTLETFDVGKSCTMAYHPQGGGMVKWFDPSLIQLQCSYVSKEADWEYYLPLVLFVYRTACRPFLQRNLITLHAHVWETIQVHWCPLCTCIWAKFLPSAFPSKAVRTTGSGWVEYTRGSYPTGKSLWPAHRRPAFQDRWSCLVVCPKLQKAQSIMGGEWRVKLVI